MKPTHVAASLILLLLTSTVAPAMDLSGQSRSYVSYRQEFEGTRVLPLYEYLDLQTTNIGDESVAFQFGGWYRYDFKAEQFGTKSTGDLQYAYLDLRRKQANTFLRIGRVIVNEGVANEQVDGAYARTDLRGGFTVAAFGGIPVETSVDTRTGDSVYGGRISQGYPGIYTIGLSYLHEKNDSKDFRKEEGIDVWLQPFRKMTVQGLSSYNALSDAWMQHRYFVLFGPFGDLRLTGEASKVYYKEYFAATNLSAFTSTGFASSSIDPNETVTALGGSADYSITSSVTIGADFKNYDYDLANNSAKYYGGRLAYAAKGFGFGLAAHRMDGPTADKQYDDQRIYLTKQFSMMDVTLDLLHVNYKQPINDVDNAYTGTAAAGFTLSPKARLVADVEYSKNPYFDKDVRGMLRFVYNFDATIPSKAKKAAGAAAPNASNLISRYPSTVSGGASPAASGGS